MLYKVEHKTTGKTVAVYGVRGDRFLPQFPEDQPIPENAFEPQFLIYSEGKFKWSNANNFKPIELPKKKIEKPIKKPVPPTLPAPNLALKEYKEPQKPKGRKQ